MGRNLLLEKNLPDELNGEDQLFRLGKLAAALGDLRPQYLFEEQIQALIEQAHRELWKPRGAVSFPQNPHLLQMTVLVECDCRAVTPRCQP